MPESMRSVQVLKQLPLSNNKERKVPARAYKAGRAFFLRFPLTPVSAKLDKASVRTRAVRNTALARPEVGLTRRSGTKLLEVDGSRLVFVRSLIKL